MKKQIAPAFLILNISVFLFAVLVHGCRDWDNPIEEDPELVKPQISSIKLNDENDIEITLSNSYSNEVDVILEKKSDDDFEEIDYQKQSNSVLIDNTFDKEVSKNFTYRIKAQKEKLTSNYSEEKSFDYKATELFSPSNFILSTIEAVGIKLQWNNTSKNQDSIEIQKKTGTNEFLTLTYLQANATSYLDSIQGGFDPPLNITYKIRGYNSELSTKWVEKKMDYSGLGKPTNLKISGLKPNGLELEWDDNSNVETGYSLERKKGDEVFKEIANLSSNQTSYTDNISETGRFSYRIRAIKNEHYSPYSDTLTYNSSVSLIDFGDVINGQISTEGEISTFKFNVEANDILLIQAISNDIHTRFELYDLEGTLIWEGGSGGWLRYRSQKLAKGGIYTLFVFDHGANNTGAFDLTIQRLNDPADKQEIDFGEIITDRIDKGIELETYTFNVKTNDVILIQSSTGEIHTRYELYDSEGNLLYEGGSGGWLRYRTEKINKDDQYTLLVMDSGGNNTGTYDLTIQRVNDPADTQAIDFGEIITDRIDKGIELETYTFNVKTNDIILIQSSTSAIHTRYELYDSEGNLLYEGGSGGWLRYRTEKITKDDQYTLLVMDSGGNNTGTYDLTIQRVNDPADTQEIDFGEIVTDRIDKGIELEVYNFNVEVNDIILIQSISGEIHTRYELYDSEGNLLYEGGSGGWLRYRSQKITKNDHYTLLVMDSGGNNTGTYDLTVQRVNDPVDIQEIDFGEIITDRIDNRIELEVYTFNVEVNDIILIQSITGAIHTRYELYDSEGNLLYEGGSGGWLRYRSQKITENDGYTLLVMDSGGNDTGAYDLTIQRVNDPVDIQVINFGEIITDRIDKGIELEVYTFNVEVNDIILIQSITGAIHTRYELYDSEGNLIYEGGSGGWLRYRSQKITENDRYTLLVMDSGGNNTGAYDLTIQRVNDPADTQEIDFGEIITDRIDKGIELEVYTFNVEVNDIILIQSISGEIHTRYELYDSEGNLLHDGGSGGWLRYRTQKITKDDKYTLLVMDNGGNNTGSYDLTIQRLNNPSNTQQIAFGEIILDGIDQRIEMETYSFTVNANDMVLIQAASHGIHTRFELYDSDGILVKEGGSGGWVRFESLKLAKGGRYSLLVMDSGGNNTGTYDLTVQRLNNPASATKVAVGDSLVVSTSNIIEIKTFSFETNASVEIELSMGRINGSISPRIEFYNPEGILVYSGSSSSVLNSGKLQLNDSGKYTVLAMDQNADGTGTFYLKLE